MRSGGARGGGMGLIRIGQLRQTGILQGRSDLIGANQLSVTRFR